MKRGKSILVISLLFIVMIILPQPLKSQTFVEVQVNQAPLLTANAGSDVTIDVGLSLTLGGTPVATGGTGSLTYYWDPPYHIEQATLPNPLATPPGNVTYTLMVADERGCYATDEIVVTVIGGTGIADQNEDGDLVIYPNPSNGAITLEILNNRSDEIQISVMTMTGQVVHNEIFTSAGTSIRTAIDLSSLPKGSYILLISNDFNEVFRHVILN
jgi:hypothetical protein